jgi:nucleoside phosphorylase
VGIIPYDHIIDTPQGPELRQVFPRPSALLTHRAKMLEADELLGHRPWETLLDTMTSTFPAFDRPAAETDRLFASDDEDADEIAHPDPTRSGHRPGRPKVHYGRIGSADTSMRNTTSRDQVAARYAVRAIEMEGRGVGTAAFASGREWFVLRGISDYADSRVNRVWRPYAAAVAAAYVAALLAQCPSIDPHGGHTHGAGGA